MLASAPKKKRIKIAPAPPPPYVPVTNLRDLPDELMSEVLAFLTPNADHSMRTECALVVLSRVSKLFRALALNDRLWCRVCVGRWKTKAGFDARLANAEAEAKKDTDNAFLKGGYWYRKFFFEERDAARTTISRDELHSTTFSVRLWFQSKLHPEMRRMKDALASGLDGQSLTDTLRFESSNGKISGMPESFDGMPFFVNDAGSIVNLGMSFEEGTHELVSLYVHRRKDWGWEFRSQLYAVRSVDTVEDTVEDKVVSMDKLWKDYASSLVIQKRRKGTVCTRGSIKYKRREVPDVEEVKEFLTW